jgi:hypothetical protein
MKHRTLTTLLLCALAAATPGAAFCAAPSLSLDTEYRLQGLSYPNLDYDISTSTDARAYYVQRLRLTLKGSFIPDTEIITRIQAIGVVSSSATPADYDWQRAYPYPNTNFAPFVENAYINVKNLAGNPAELTIGRQPLEIGDGMIVSDNGSGMNAIRLGVTYPLKLHTDLFTAKIKERYTDSSDNDINGAILTYPFRKFNLEFGYFGQNDSSGTKYRQGTKIGGTKSINKQFYDFRLFDSGAWGTYSVEYAFQKGKINPESGNGVDLNARGFIAKARLINERSRLGKVSGFGMLAATTGNKKVGITPPAGEWNPTDEEFNPDFTKKYDGLMRTGWGNFFSATVLDSFFDVPTDKSGKDEIPNFSGFGTFGLGMDFSPWFGWTFGFAGFYYNAGTSYNKGAPVISGGFASSGSGIETLSALIIADDISSAKRYNLGAELDMFAAYEYSKYLEFKIGYSRYTPPSFAGVWPKINNNEQFLFEMTCRF